MKEWKSVVLPTTTTLRDTIVAIDNSAMQIALIVDQGEHLLGTVTDGDIRRAILKGITLDDTVDTLMNPGPVIARADDSRDTILSIMQRHSIHHLPVVDQHNRLVGVEMLDDILMPTTRNNPVVLMAGGFGTRLRPLTNTCPKPLLKVGNKPILETILESCIEHGFRQFHLSVNYKAEMIEQYFGDGSRWGVDISYLREPERLGTAGALGMLKVNAPEPVLVMNGDILTKINFNQLLAFHSDHRAKATMCVREYEFQVPYGVAHIEKSRLTGIEEKPSHRCFINAGIYVLEPEILSMISNSEFLDMPSLFEMLISQNLETAAFPIREYWLDIGRMDDFERAISEFDEVFV